MKNLFLGEKKNFSKNIAKIIDFSVMGDGRGSLISLEEKITVPFSIKRIYYIFGTKKGVSRGFHAHYNLKQIIIAVSGKCRLLLDDGNIRESILLDSPNRGILIDGLVWREMHDFSEDCVLLVLASELYSELDYIKDYEIFLKNVKE